MGSPRGRNIVCDDEFMLGYQYPQLLQVPYHFSSSILFTSLVASILLEAWALGIGHNSTRIEGFLQPVCEYQQTIRYIVDFRVPGANVIARRVRRQPIRGVVARLLAGSHLRPTFRCEVALVRHFR